MIYGKEYLYVTESSLHNGLCLWPWIWKSRGTFVRGRSEVAHCEKGSKTFSHDADNKTDQLVAVLERKRNNYELIEISEGWKIEKGMRVDGTVVFFDDLFYKDTELPPMRRIITLPAGNTVRYEGTMYTTLNKVRVMPRPK